MEKYICDKCDDKFTDNVKYKQHQNKCHIEESSSEEEENKNKDENESSLVREIIKEANKFGKGPKRFKHIEYLV